MRRVAAHAVAVNLRRGMPVAVPAVLLVPMLVTERAPGWAEVPWMVLTAITLATHHLWLTIARRSGLSDRVERAVSVVAATVSGAAFGATPTLAHTPTQMTIAMLCLAVVLFGNAVYTAPAPPLVIGFHLGALAVVVPTLVARGDRPAVLLPGLAVVVVANGLNAHGLWRTVTSNIATSRRNEALAAELGQANAELTAAVSTIEAMAAMDELTSLPNRRAFLAALHDLLAAGTPCVVAMLDADHFKLVNDGYGHAAGDAALVAIARSVGRELRPNDLLGRLGGEEFAIALPGLGLDEGRHVLERVRQAVAADTAAGSAVVPVTVSIGATAAWPRAGVSEVLSAADEALYTAKRAGRNRTETGQRPRPAEAAGPAVPPVPAAVVDRRA